MPRRRPTLPRRARAAITEVVGEQHLIVDPDVVHGNEIDWTGRFEGMTSAVVRPADTAEVAAVLAICHAESIALVPQGGNTGLVGGGVPLSGEMVLSLTRLTELGPVDELAAQVTAGAGVTLGSLHRHAGGSGLAYGVDLAARETATVGGTVATNAGGVHVLRWGSTRRQVLGLEAVTADGRVLRHLDGLVKDNTGYDLSGLLCGSEGTLAVVTAARLALVPRQPCSVVALCAFADVADAVRIAAEVHRRLDCLDAAEIFLGAGLELVREVTGRAAPFTVHHPVYVLFEASGSGDPSEALASVLADQAGVLDVAVATDAGRRGELWALREDHTAAINTLGPPHKLDVTLPLGELAGFVDLVPEVVRTVAPEARCWQFGHVGDGNVHVNVTGLAPDDERVDDAVLSLVVSLGGSISAEHGIGTAKRRWLPLQRSVAELDTFRAIKAAFDPKGILNPHVLV
ncbi:MAG TPA: FAD-binding oxidoreductase [Acidimicrobiales bacterium]